MTKKEKKNIDNVDLALSQLSVDSDFEHYESLYQASDDEELYVWSLLNGKGEDSLNNYGIVIRYKNRDFKFPNVCHGNMPELTRINNNLILAGGILEGTGTRADCLYIFDLEANGDVKLVKQVDPYDVEKYFIDKIKYDINTDKITFKINNKKVTTVTSTEDGMGKIVGIGLGEQIWYTFADDSSINIQVAPGIIYELDTTPLYDDTPIFYAEVKVKKNDISFGNIKILEE